MHPKIEICVDNIESVVTANRLPIDRIELCSALSLGGISPNYGLIQAATAISTIPLSIMIRPRAGDFLFNEREIQMMITEIELAKEMGVQHIVIGALTEEAMLDLSTIRRLIQVAKGIEITFHRAFDLCVDPFIALEQLIDLGCARILTSGQAPTAFQGQDILQKLVEQADNRIQIMAGCGISAENIETILARTQVPEIHFSAKGTRLSKMRLNSMISMGKERNQENYVDILSFSKAQQILQKIGKLK